MIAICCARGEARHPHDDVAIAAGRRDEREPAARDRLGRPVAAQVDHDIGRVTGVRRGRAGSESCAGLRRAACAGGGRSIGSGGGDSSGIDSAAIDSDGVARSRASSVSVSSADAKWSCAACIASAAPARDSAGSATLLAFRREFGTMWTSLGRRGRAQIRGVTFPLLQKGHVQEGATPSGRRPHDVLAGRCVAPGSERRQLCVRTPHHRADM